MSIQNLSFGCVSVCLCLLCTFACWLCLMTTMTMCSCAFATFIPIWFLCTTVRMICLIIIIHLLSLSLSLSFVLACAPFKPFSRTYCFLFVSVIINIDDDHSMTRRQAYNTFICKQLQLNKHNYMHARGCVCVRVSWMWTLRFWNSGFVNMLERKSRN